jgi:hypothetical protein
MKRPGVCLAGLLLALPAMAQQSISYQLTDHTFNAGGRPEGGVVAASTSYQITLDAIGDAVSRRGLSSTSYRMDGGFVGCYPPPGEVLDLSFLDPITLTWHPEGSVGDYNLYRDLMSDLSGLGYGTCEQQEIGDNTTTVDDTDDLSPGEGYFYLVTAENRLDEEGTKGRNSGGTERQGAICP